MHFSLFEIMFLQFIINLIRETLLWSSFWRGKIPVFQQQDTTHFLPSKDQIFVEPRAIDFGFCTEGKKPHAAESSCDATGNV